MKLATVCAALLLGVGITIIYKDRIAADPVGFTRDCASRGGKVRMEFSMRQCVGAKRKTEDL